MFKELQVFTNFYFSKFKKVLHILTLPIIALYGIALTTSFDSFLFSCKSFFRYIYVYGQLNSMIWHFLFLISQITRPGWLCCTFTAVLVATFHQYSVPLYWAINLSPLYSILHFGSSFFLMASYKYFPMTSCQIGR